MADPRTRDEDLLKTRSWGFPGVETLDELRHLLASVYPYNRVTGVAGPATVFRFLCLPAAEAMPQPLLLEAAAWCTVQGLKHVEERLPPPVRARLH